MSLQAGSVVARLRVTVQDPEFPVGVSTLAPMLPRLWASTVFQIDQRGTLVQGRRGDPEAPGGSDCCRPAFSPGFNTGPDEAVPAFLGLLLSGVPGVRGEGSPRTKNSHQVPSNLSPDLDWDLEHLGALLPG